VKTRMAEGVEERWCPSHNEGEGAWIAAILFHRGDTTTQCKECRKIYGKMRYDAHQASLKNYLSYHDTDYEAFQRLLALQNGCCALCIRKADMKKVGRKRAIPALRMEQRNGHPYALLCDGCYMTVQSVSEGFFTVKDLKDYVSEGRN
jgi:hypothetical protein